MKWDPYELSDGHIAVNSSVLIPLPEAEDFIIQAERKEIAEHSETLTQSEYVRFFSTCVELLKAQTEKALNETMVLQPDWGKTWARLYVEKQQGKMTDDLRDWAVEKMHVLIRSLQPELDKTKGG